MLPEPAVMNAIGVLAVFFFLLCTGNTVFCPVFRLYWTFSCVMNVLCCVHYTKRTGFCPVYGVYCLLYSVLATLHIVPCTSLTEFCPVYMLHFVKCSVLLFVLYFAHCTVGTVVPWPDMDDYLSNLYISLMCFIMCFWIYFR